MNLKQIQEAPPRELIYTSPDKGSRKGKVHLVLTRPIGNMTHGITACGLHVLPKWIEIGAEKVNCKVCARDIRESKIQKRLGDAIGIEEALRNRIDCLKAVLHCIAGLSPDQSKYRDGETPFAEAVRQALTGIHNLETGFYDHYPITLTQDARNEIPKKYYANDMYKMLKDIFESGRIRPREIREIIEKVEKP